MAIPMYALLMAATNPGYKRHQTVQLNNVWQFICSGDKNYCANFLGITPQQFDELSDMRLVGTEQQARQFVRHAFGDLASSVEIKRAVFEDYAGTCLSDLLYGLEDQPAE